MGILALRSLFKASLLDYAGAVVDAWSLIFSIQVCINCLNNSLVKGRTRAGAGPNPKRKTKSGSRVAIGSGVVESLLEFCLAEPIAKQATEP